MFQLVLKIKSNYFSIFAWNYTFLSWIRNFHLGTASLCHIGPSSFTSGGIYFNLVAAIFFQIPRTSLQEGRRFDVCDCSDILTFALSDRFADPLECSATCRMHTTDHVEYHGTLLWTLHIKLLKLEAKTVFRFGRPDPFKCHKTSSTDAVLHADYDGEVYFTLHMLVFHLLINIWFILF